MSYINVSNISSASAFPYLPGAEICGKLLKYQNGEKYPLPQIEETGNRLGEMLRQFVLYAWNFIALIKCGYAKLC